MKELDDLKQMAECYAIKYEDKGNGHIQLSNHGVLVNYYPLSKNRTVFCNGKTTKHCSNYDAIKICMKSGETGLKPRKKNITEKRPPFSLKPVNSKKIVRHLYNGKTPPWEFPTRIMCYPDILRIEATQLLDRAEQQDNHD